MRKLVRLRATKRAHEVGINISWSEYDYVVHFINHYLSFQVYCDMTSGGWTRIQHRSDGSVNFYRLWDEYKTGFGEPDAEHWIGNEIIHTLTQMSPHRLRVDLTQWNGVYTFAVYDTFRIANENSRYRLTISGYSGNASDGLIAHNNYVFDTKDSDTTGCAVKYMSGWWLHSCYISNLNNIYWYEGKCNYSSEIFECVHWQISPHTPYRVTTMKIQGNYYEAIQICY